MAFISAKLKDDWWSTYQKKLRHPRWQRKRLEVFSRDGWKCRKCKDTETTLQVHHLKYFPGKDPWDIDSNYLVTLCEPCHDWVTKRNRKLRAAK